MPTRQTSSSGRPKSPRIQVVLPEELCARLSALAEAESRTVSNMAKVLIQQGVERLEAQLGSSGPAALPVLPGLATPLAPPAGSSGPARSGETARDSCRDAARETCRDVAAESAGDTDRFREALERQQQSGPRRLRGAPRRLRLQRPPT